MSLGLLSGPPKIEFIKLSATEHLSEVDFRGANLAEAYLSDADLNPPEAKALVCPSMHSSLSTISRLSTAQDHLPGNDLRSGTPARRF
ncbi:MAG: pentapeptide repeat-containing protein [Deltaproteobacteria bacterium]|nr:pentapeptide repeat-containing protein [Deltaproteobacteria bacterium]